MKLYVGIDVSKDTLDVCFLDETDKCVKELKVKNEKSGHLTIQREIKRLAKGDAVQVCLESTGSYSFDVASYLAKEVPVSVVNPLKVNRYAQAIARCKTDKVDARVIALYAHHIPFVPWKAPSPEAFEFRSLMRQVAYLKKQIAALRNRRHAAGASEVCGSRTVKSSCAKVITCLQREIESLVVKARAIAFANKEIRERCTLILTIKGIGEASAMAIVADLALFSSDITTRQAVALAGLDPNLKQSGTSLNAPPRMSKKGISSLRAALFFPAMVAVRFQPNVRAYYQSVLQRTKKKMKALVAAMRRLLHTIIGMIKSGTAFDPARFFPLPA